MNFGLLHPAALWALAALALPIVVHLYRRSRTRTVQFAALRWLSERQRPRQRPRLEQWLLLLLRLLLLALLAVLLAQPVWTGAKVAPHWGLLLPGVNTEALPHELSGAELHWLAPGFPPWQAGDAAPTPPLQTASLLRELDAMLPASTRISVLVPEQLGGLDATALVLSRPLDWVVQPGRSSPELPAAAVPLSIQIWHESNSTQLRWLQALLAAWKVLLPELQVRAVEHPAAGTSAPTPDGAQWLIWLDAPLSPNVQQWLQEGGRIVQFGAGRDSASGLQQARIGAGRHLWFNAELAPESMSELLDPAFPAELLGELLSDLPPPDRAFATSVMPVVTAQAWPPRPRSIATGLGLLIAALFLLERLLAGRRAGVPA